jgi:hypothetical protein
MDWLQPLRARLRGLTGRLNSVRLKEPSHRCSKLHDVRLQSKMPCVKHLHLGIGNVFSERFRPCGNEERIVFAPNCQQRRLHLAYRDECAPMGKISCTRLFGEERANVSFEDQWFAISSMADRDPFLRSTRTVRGISLKSHGSTSCRRQARYGSHRPSLGWLLTLQKGAHQPHLRRSD